MLRLAIISSPRSGNTWLRHLLSSIYGLEPVLAFSPAGVDWDSIPDRCLLQTHWHRTDDFLKLLARHDFRVVALARHPLDLLLSILQFAAHEPLTARWLEGEGGDESSIVGARPRSPEFVQYATSRRAVALLSVTSQWWRSPGCWSLRYRDLVADPSGQLGRLDEALGGARERRTTIADAVAANTLQRLRPTSGNRHFWQGRPALWRELLTAAEARRIADAHRAAFEQPGFEVDPDPALDGRQADANWDRLTSVKAAS